MDETRNGSHRQELVEVIRKVRSRWRTRLLMRGAIVVLLGALVALALAAFGLQTYKFSPSSVVAFRIAVFAAFGLLLVWWFASPFRRRVSDMQVALYLEENEPSLQAAILSAVDVGAVGAAGQTAAEVPPVIIERIEYGSTASTMNTWPIASRTSTSMARKCQYRAHA